MINLFITFEGIDGSGKSLMIKLTAEKLCERGFDVLTTREPGGSNMGQSIRKMILDSPPGQMDKRTETLLFAADRSLHVSTVIKPALANNQIVISDRYIDSSFAYQGSGRELSSEDIRSINLFAIDGLLPDLTFLLDLPVEHAFARIRRKRDRMEQEDMDFFRRTAAAYRELASAEPQRFVVIDATQNIESELNDIIRHLDRHLLGKHE